eukprot:911330-Pyramimonas_sp.AAC.1
MAAPNISCVPTGISAESSCPTRSTCVAPPRPPRPRGAKMPDMTGMRCPTPLAKALLLFACSTR